MDNGVDLFISDSKFWQAEMSQLRNIVLDCGLEETLKWKQPCYQYKGANILIISSFKNNCVLGFFKGVLLSDSKNKLVSPGDNSQTVKQFKFTNLESIIENETIIKSYIFEAIEIEKSGLKVEFKKSKNLEYPEELISVFKSDKKFKNAFQALSPGRQRGYNIFISAAKQSSTRLTRIQKYYNKILTGKGINDCTCGYSKRMPNCDGSHKLL